MFRIENLKVIAGPEQFPGLFESNVVLSLVCKVLGLIPGEFYS